METASELETNPGKPDTGKPPVKGMRDSFKSSEPTIREPEIATEIEKEIEKIEPKKEPDTATTPELLKGIEADDKPVKPKLEKKETGAEYIKRSEAERDAAIKASEAERKRAEEALAARAELEEQIERIRFESSPRYRREFVEPINAKIALAEKSLDGIDNAKEIISSARSLEGKARWDYLDENVESRSAASALASLLIEIDGLEARRQESVEQHKTISEKHAREVGQRADALVGEVFDRVGKSISERLSVFRKTGDSKIDSAVDARIEQVKMLLSGAAGVDDQAAAAFLAVSAPEYIRANRELTSENSVLRERLAKFEGGNPSINGREEPQPKDVQPVGLRQRTSEWLKGR